MHFFVNIEQFILDSWRVYYWTETDIAQTKWFYWPGLLNGLEYPTLSS